jgi:DNA-binding NarL/FixJ family response regulator
MSKIRVLIVDHHAIVREGVRHLLADHADIAVVGEAGAGREALEQSRALHPHVVLLGIALPDLSGIEVTGRIRKEQPETRVVIFSAHEKEDFVHQALRAGAVGYVLKSAPSANVLEAVRAAYRGEYFLCPRIRTSVIRTFLQGKPEGPPTSPHELLSEREMQVFRLLVSGKSTGEIAGMLFLSPKTTEKHRANILQKLGCRNLVELVKYAIQHGITGLDA